MNDCGMHLLRSSASSASISLLASYRTKGCRVYVSDVCIQETKRTTKVLCCMSPVRMQRAKWRDREYVRRSLCVVVGRVCECPECVRELHCPLSLQQSCDAERMRERRKMTVCMYEKVSRMYILEGKQKKKKMFD